MRYRMLNKKEWDMAIKASEILQSMPGYWRPANKIEGSTCIIDSMFEYFGKEIPNYSNGHRAFGYVWTDWMVRSYKFNPSILNDKIIISTIDKQDLQKFYKKRSKK